MSRPPLAGLAAAGPARTAATRAERALALGALAFLLAVTVVWWALALWPLPARAPAWLQAARAVCFGAHDDGLPGAGGWILLVGEPVGMATALFVLAGEPLRAGLRGLTRSRAGRAGLAVTGLALLAGAGAAGLRVRQASAAPSGMAAAPRLERLDEPAPALALVDQQGGVTKLQRFRGRPVLVTFAYAHCATVCPLLVHDALAAQRHASPRPALLVVTLDPWRDTPARLPHLAASWGLGADAFVLGGPVAEVEGVLAAWRVPLARDDRTGEVTHGPVTYVVDGAGRLRYATAGRRAELLEALARVGGT